MTRMIDADTLLEWLDEEMKHRGRSGRIVPGEQRVWRRVRDHVLASLCPDQPEGK